MGFGTHVALSIVMQQVANTHSKVASGPAPKRQMTACLRLSRGASAQATWLLEDAPGGTTIRVGADATCDWQIRAACVPDHALTVMLVGGTLFVKSSQSGGVLLDGRQLGQPWTEVTNGARLDIGLSRIEIALGEASSAFDGLPQAYVAPIDTRDLPYESMRTMEYRLDDIDQESIYINEPGTSPQAATFAELTQPQQALRESLIPRESQRESVIPRESRVPRQSAPELNRPSFLGRLSRPSMMGAPSLLDDGTTEKGGTNLRKLALAGLATALAYAGWLMLLDHL